jgi:tetratricopeptide (TPR) repeat protein
MNVRDDDSLRRAVAGLPAAGPCPGEARLLAFYRGELEEDRADAIREHLATCPACLELARDAREFLAALRGAEPAPAVPPGRVTAVPRSRRTALWIAAAAVAALAALGLYAIRTERPARPAEVVWRGDDGSAAYEAAMEHFRAGRFEAAEAALETYVLAHPADDRARLDLAVTRIRVGRTADARRELAQLAEQGEDAVRAEARRWLAELDRGGAP